MDSKRTIIIILGIINILFLSYDIHLYNQTAIRNRQYALDWNSNEEALLAGVETALKDGTMLENPWINEGIYQRNHDLWEKGYLKVTELVDRDVIEIKFNH